METYDKEDKKISDAWIKAYTKISKLTGIKLEDTVNYSYGIVVRGDRKGELFGKIGVYERSESSISYFRFKGKRKLIGFSNEEDFFWAKNVIMLLEEREKLFRLF